MIPDCPPNLHLSILHQSLARHKTSYMIWDNKIDFPHGSLLFSATKTNNHGDFIWFLFQIQIAAGFINNQFDPEIIVFFITILWFPHANSHSKDHNPMIFKGCQVKFEFNCWLWSHLSSKSKKIQAVAILKKIYLPRIRFWKLQAFGG